MAYARAYSRSRGGFFSGLARTVGRVAGFVGRAAGILPPAMPSLPSLPGVMPGGTPTLGSTGQRPRPGVRGAVQRMLPGGESGYLPRKRMNAGNAKAARRAIRRIKSVRKLLQSIERELPRRPAARSAGVITRREAERALRS